MEHGGSRPGRRGPPSTIYSCYCCCHNDRPCTVQGTHGVCFDFQGEEVCDISSSDDDDDDLNDVVSCYSFCSASCLRLSRMLPSTLFEASCGLRIRSIFGLDAD